VELLALYGDSAGQIGLDGARSNHTRPMQVANHTCSVYPKPTSNTTRITRRRK
jgi:hypothetical protein